MPEEKESFGESAEKIEKERSRDYTCNKCSPATTWKGEKGIKRHLTLRHGGYTVDDLKDAGIVPTKKDIARSVAGFNSAKEVSEKAPAQETLAGMEAPGPSRKEKKAAESAAVIQAREQILRMRCKRAAELPYQLLSMATKDASFKLSDEESAMLSEAYLTLAKAYGWEGTSKFLLWGDVLILHVAVAAQRSEAFKSIIAPEKIDAFGKDMPVIGSDEPAKQ